MRKNRKPFKKRVEINPLRPDTSILKKAAEILEKGEVIALPTDTFYALGADGLNPEAIKKVYEIKGREYKKPILFLISDRALLPSLVSEIPPVAERLISSFWPGPLTIIFKASPKVPPALMGEGDKIGIRIPNNRIAREVSRLLGGPITGTSANLSGEPSPVSAESVISSLGKRLTLILDTGNTPGGLESTIIDVTLRPPKLVRKGKISAEEIEKVIGEIDEDL